MTNDEFKNKLVTVVKEKNLAVDDVARNLGLSRATVNRWLAGESAPFRTGRDSVFTALEKL